MDGLSAAANIIAVLQLTQAVAVGLRTFYRHVRDARAEIDKLYSTIIGLEIIFKRLDSLSKQSGHELLDSILWSDPQGPLKQASNELILLKDQLEVQHSKKQQLEKVMKSLRISWKWPFKQDEIASIVNRLEGHKSTLLLQLSSHNL